MKRLLIVLAVVMVGAVAVYGAGLAFLFYKLTQSDPYPAFLADFQKDAPRLYSELGRSFTNYVVREFPVGSNADNATEKFVSGGFRVLKSTAEKTELVWTRHAGPCDELHLVVISKDSDQKITDITGKITPACL